MEHIYSNPNFGENWFDYSELYSKFIELAKPNAKIVEVGCWKGKSVAYLAVEAINSGKNISIDAIDTWLGSPEHAHHECTKNDSLYRIFLNNIEPVSDIVTSIRLDSISASKNYVDNSIDIVFLDAAHDYDSVLADIKHWLPKVKDGGILAGHDFNYTWEGVMRAVRESFDAFDVEGPCWVYHKPTA
jgi:SAM-dependent methyltransferase